MERTSSWSWFYVSRNISAKTCSKNDFHVAAPMTLTFNLLFSKLLWQLFLTWVASPLSLNVVRFSFFELTIGTHGLTDRQTYAGGVTRNATYRVGLHINRTGTLRQVYHT